MYKLKYKENDTINGLNENSTSTEVHITDITLHHLVNNNTNTLWSDGILMFTILQNNTTKNNNNFPKLQALK